MTDAKRSNRLSGADAVVRMLEAHGVSHVFGLCGDTSLPLYDALARLDHGITHVLTRDERSAAYMADGYARVTGKVGICEGPSGGGATYILPGLVEANESSVPVLAITTDVPVKARGRYPLTELDQASLFAPLTKWNKVIDTVDEIPLTMRTAFRAATTGKPGACHIGLPYDVQKQTLAGDDVWGQPEHGAAPSWRSGADPQAVAAAADRLLAARLPVFVVGGGVVTSGAGAALIELAEALDAPVCTTITGKGAVAETHPLAVGVVGANGGVPATRNVIEQADLVVFVSCRAGSTTTEHGTAPKPGVPIIHIDIDPMVISCNYATDVAIVADARLALEALGGAIRNRPRRRVADSVDGRPAAEAAKKEKWAEFNKIAASEGRPIRPERVFAALNAALPENSIVAADPGTPCPYASAYLEMRRPGRYFITNRAHGALGYSMSAAVGAWFGRPDAMVVSLMGDGSFGFTVGELETIQRHNVPLKMIVFSNAVFGWIKASQKDGYDERYFSVDFNRTDHAKVAETYGVKAFRVEDPLEVETAIRAALEYPGAALVDVISQQLQDAAAPVSQWMG
ncbi:thiamine pyrophosphate-binding protein [Pikeienuella piscinae]|uniref:Thiamine pyrophosphate-binding protein n=1 Tax=Pikeienuella piscinae TaxID=2748098 RepID=A0A7L5BWY9_9RHOB|nr:thiamine pyrophosphate-binding protein [Pikeienuella piscinae]QIE54394.1 thiamine pyrophosphate-binding protein [Pikeienuella piscinae]